MIVPASYNWGATTTYVFTFTPVTFQQGMQIQVTFPSQVNFATNATNVCLGLNGTDNPTFTCTIDKVNKIVKL